MSILPNNTSNDHSTEHRKHRKMRSKGATCGIADFNETVDIITHSDQIEHEAFTETDDGRGIVIAKATDHGNAHYSAEAQASAAAKIIAEKEIGKVNAGAKAEVGLGGALAEVGVDVEVLEEENDEGRLKVLGADAGARAGAGLGGVVAQAEAGVTLIEKSRKFGNRQEVDAEVRLNVDTGVDIGLAGVEANVAGMGVALGRRTGIKTFLGGIKVKLW